jgi:anion-transporting  ArsA/GET3 family ATPase
MSLRERRLLFVTGKGGVGKTTVAAALARSLADQGKRVWLCSVDDRPDLAEAFGLPTLAMKPTPVDERLSVSVMNTESALREYLQLFVKVPIVTKLGPFASALDFVATAAPGVREILTVGKICYEVRERHYDVVVVDAPATGHLPGYLATPQTINSLVSIGLLRGQSDWLRDLLGDPAITGVIAVTTPEEMPVRETRALCDALASTSGVSVAALVVNKMPPVVVADDDAPRADVLLAQLRDRSDALAKALVAAVDIGRTRREGADEALALLESLLPAMTPVNLPLCFGADGARAVVAELASHLDEVWR